MTRIIAGELGGRRLRTPPGNVTRPTSDRVREALFSRIESLLGNLDDAIVLDLYAGSGAVGLEAISRGASFAELVESNRRVAVVADANVEALGVGCRTRIVLDRVERVLSRPASRSADLVFADPPYGMSSSGLRETLADALRTGWLADGALVVVERPSRLPWTFPAGIVDEGQRRYGETTLWYGRQHPG